MDVETVHRFIKKNIDAMERYRFGSFSPFHFTLFNSLLLAFDEFPFISGTRRHRRTFFHGVCIFLLTKKNFDSFPFP